MNRRQFLNAAAAALSAISAGGQGETKRKWRVGVIGHTGRGNYGHGLDTVWLKLPETEIAGVADADPGGLTKAVKRLPGAKGFADYRVMLPEVRPDLVSVCPRNADLHFPMALAAIEAGAKGVYVEKPFCRTPQEADQLAAACRKHGAKIAVAHRNRYDPTLVAIDKVIAEGGIGKVLEIRGRGKGDHRGGGEDLWVLGSHIMDLIHYFGGHPLACSATMLQDGRPVTKADVKEGNEGLGPLAGNEVHARYRMDRGMLATFDSLANDTTENAGFGLQIIGSKGIIALRADCSPLAHLVPGNPFLPTDTPRPWIPISSAGAGNPEPRADIPEAIHNHVLPVRDLIEAVEKDREPRCGMDEGTMTVEMICAVFCSHQQGGREVTFPLAERHNALALL